MKEALGNFGGWLDEMIVWFQQPWNKPIPSMESASGPSAAPDGEKSFEGDAVRLLDLWEAMEAHPFAQHSSGTIDLRQLGMFIGRFSAQSAGVKERHRNLLDTVTRLKVRAMLMCRNMVGYSGTLNVDTCMICFIQISEACPIPSNDVRDHQSCILVRYLWHMATRPVVRSWAGLYRHGEE